MTNAVHVYRSEGDEWGRETILSDESDSNDFGATVAVSGDGSTALIGAATDTNGNGYGAGSAYIFERIENSWEQTAKLIAPEGSDQDFFAKSVSLSNDGRTAYIGASGVSIDATEQAGAVYVFSHSGDSWEQMDTIFPTDPVHRGKFGIAVSASLDGSNLLIGSVGGNSGEQDETAYIFEESGNNWQQRQTLNPTETEERNTEFGSVVSISDNGTTAFVGAPQARGPRGQPVGAVHVFKKSDRGWSRSAVIHADDGERADFFGAALSVSRNGRLVLVGAIGDEHSTRNGAGSAYLFEQVDNEWQQREKLIPPEEVTGQPFATSVSVSDDGNMALVSVEDGPVYIFD